MVACRRINTDIGKVEIERDENPFLSLSRAEHSWIGVPSQLLGQRGMHVVTGLLQQDRSITRKIFVELESGRHPTRLSGDGNDTFSR